jgi:predicted RNase H-like HicB family nuclease
MGLAEYTIIIRREESAGVWAWVARVPELPGCACTEGTPEAALRHIKKSIRAYLQEMKSTQKRASANSLRPRTKTVSSR